MPSWECKLTAFEGPLDLLLHLIKQAKIDIEDIFMSEITDQYLEYMKNVGELDMERASEFINMASLLIYIKSRSLLPAVNISGEEDEDDYIDPEAALLERLRQYQLFKESTEMFRMLAEQAGEYFYKLPEDWVEEEDDYSLLDLDVKDIEKAFLKLIERSLTPDDSPIMQISQDLFSIKKQKNKIKRMLEMKNKFTFSDLFGGIPAPMEIAVTLFALLELWHIGKVKITQSKPFSQITVSAS